MTKTFPLLPDNTCPELAGYKLPELPRSQEDDVEQMAKEEFNNIDNPIRSGIDNHSYKTGFTEGYRKAREKFEFSESDLRKAISWATNKARRGDISAKDIDDFIISLRTPRTPIAIEVEMVEATDWIETHGNMIMTPIVCIKPATNPDGTVKGIYIYE